MEPNLLCVEYRANFFYISEIQQSNLSIKILQLIFINLTFAYDKNKLIIFSYNVYLKTVF